MAFQNQKVYYEKCYICGREFNVCSIKFCKGINQKVCCYCCKNCENNINFDIGQSCKLDKGR